MTEEIWKDIPEYEGLYRVSSHGRFMSMKKFKWKMDYINSYPHIYKTKALFKNGIKKTTFAHRLVAMAFIPNPENKPVVNHKDLNPGNNRVDNLEWVTSSENSQHAVNNFPLTVYKNPNEIIGYRPRKQLSYTDPIYVDNKIFKDQYQALMESRK